MLILHRPRRGPPQETPRVNWRSSLTAGLRFLAPLRGQLAVDLVSGRSLTKTGALVPASALNGVYPTFASSQYIDVPFDLSGISGTTPVTIAWTQEARATSAYSTVFHWKPAGATNAFLIYQAASDANYYFVVGPGNGTYTQAATFSAAAGAVTNNRLDRLCLVLPAGTADATNATLYRNGVAIARGTSTSLNSLATNTSAVFRIGELSAGGYPWEGLIGNLHIWDRVLSAHEQLAWTRNEFCTLEPQRIFIPAAVAATGSASATPANGIASVSAIGASTAASAASVAAGSASASAAAASVAASDPTAAAGAATVSGVGDVAAGSSGSATPAAGVANVSAVGSSVATADAVAAAGSSAASGVGSDAAAVVVVPPAGGRGAVTGFTRYRSSPRDPLPPIIEPDDELMAEVQEVLAVLFSLEVFT